MKNVQCDAIRKLADIQPHATATCTQVADGPRPALNGRAHASAACTSPFRRVHDSCDLAKQLRRIRQKHRSKVETETNK